MGKSMSTAKQIVRTPTTEAVAESIIQQKPNHKIVPRVQPIPINPDDTYLKKVNTVDQSFNDRLKQVFVTSINENPSLDLPKDRTKPQDRNTPFVYAPHNQETDDRSPNTLIIDDVKIMLSNHRENPDEWTADYMATKFNISKENAEKLVINYGSLHPYFSGTTEFEPSEKQLGPTSSFTDFEEMATKGLDKKYKSREDLEAEWKEWYQLTKKKKT